MLLAMSDLLAEKYEPLGIFGPGQLNNLLVLAKQHYPKDGYHVLAHGDNTVEAGFRLAQKFMVRDFNARLFLPAALLHDSSSNPAVKSEIPEYDSADTFVAISKEAGLGLTDDELKIGHSAIISTHQDIQPSENHGKLLNRADLDNVGGPTVAFMETYAALKAEAGPDSAHFDEEAINRLAKYHLKDLIFNTKDDWDERFWNNLLYLLKSQADARGLTPRAYNIVLKKMGKVSVEQAFVKRLNAVRALAAS